MQQGQSADEFRPVLGSFAVVNGPISIDAQDAVHNVSAGGVRWEKIPDYGRGVSAMSIFPMTAASVQPPSLSPYLAYSFTSANLETTSLI